MNNKQCAVISLCLAVFVITTALCCPTAEAKISKVKLSVSPLDLSKAPTTEEIIAAGQLGGQLYPTHELGDKEKEKKTNHSFGKAIQEWNKHEYKKAVKMFKKHIEEYPDSPWAAEAVLHIGCDANYNGRYSEAEENFQWILEKHKDQDNEGAKTLVNKATLRLGVLKVSQNNFDKAKELFSDLRQNSSDWRDRTYASHWIQRLSRYTANELAMLNCGTQALAYLLEKDGRVADARRVVEILPDTTQGHNMKSLTGIAAHYGYQLSAVKVSQAAIKNLPLPAIMHINGKSGGDGGHYWILEKMDNDLLALFDPQAGQRFSQHVDEFAKEWSGNALVFSDDVHSNAIPSPSYPPLNGGELNKAPRPLGEKVRERGIFDMMTYSGVGDFFAPISLPGMRLPDDEAEKVFGGCCGVPKPEDDLGEPKKKKRDPCDEAQGAPIWDVNMVNMNLFVTDIPMWYNPPIGPTVKIQLSYNSQSAIAQNEPFGNKWQFNYGSYLVVDTGDNVTVIMPDGRRDVYTPNGVGGYERPFEVFNTLTKIAENHFELQFLDGTVYVYSIPAGTSSLQPFLVEIKDAHNQKLTFGYNSSVQLETITDAANHVTTLFYNADGLVDHVNDPFGRSALFEYDANRNLTKITDMGGYWTSLSYDSDVYLTGIENARGRWNFKIEPSDGIVANSDNYPPPGDHMWENYRITVTNPLGGKEEYFYYGGNGAYSWYISPRDYLEWQSQTVNNFWVNVPRTYYYLTGVNQKGKISKISYPEGGYQIFEYDSVTGKQTKITDYHGTDSNGSPISHRTYYTYNSKGLVTSVTDARTKTTNITYYSNDVDVHTVDNGLGPITYSYNGSTHDIASITDRMNIVTSFDYESDGRLKKITQAKDTPVQKTTEIAYDAVKLTPQQIKINGNVVSSMAYDDINRPWIVTGPTGVTLTYDYNNLNQQTMTTYPDGKFETFDYSTCCPRILDSYTNRAGGTTYYIYDALKRLTNTVNPDSSFISYEYDANGNRTKLIDADQKKTSFEYNLDNRLKKKTYADGKFVEYDYDLAGLLTKLTNAKIIEKNYTYDPNHNLLTFTYSDATPGVTFTYDDYNRLDTRSDGIGLYDYDYDANNRLRFIYGPWADDTIEFQYNELGQTKYLIPQGGQTVEYVYDTIGRLTKIKPSASTFTYAYTGINPLIQSLTRPNGSVTSYEYNDPLKRLTAIINKKSTQEIINSFAYTYNNLDVRDTETITNGEVIDNFIAGTTTYTSNDLNQLTNSIDSMNSRTYLYDDDGNMTTGYTPDGYVLTMTYDAENRLKAAEYNDSNSIIHRTEYTYSGDSLLAEMKKFENGVLTADSRYLRAGFLPIQERDGNNVVVRDYTWGQNFGGGIGGLLNLRQSGNDYSYLYDGKGNVSSLLDGAQGVVASYVYDPFGVFMKKTALIDQPYMFSTKEYDMKTGLSYYGYRFYSPVLGKWITRDPLGERGGINLHGFVGNNPVNFVDPYGLFLDMSRAHEIANEASQGAKESGLTGQHNGPADAYRHCLWSCKMTKELGSGDAWVAGTGHELQGELDGQPADELRMDANNNNVGRKCGENKKDKRSCEDKCKEALVTGDLTTINPPNKGIGPY